MFWNKANKRKIVIELDENNYPAGILFFDKNQLNDIFYNLNQKTSRGSYSTDRTYEDKKDRFVEYLTEIAVKNIRNEHYATTTANSYKSAINTISNDFLNIDLWAISNSNEIKEQIESLISNTQYIKKNEESNSTLSNGLARYKEFLEYNEINNITY